MALNRVRRRGSRRAGSSRALAVLLALAPLPAVAAAASGRDAYEACLTATAADLEATGVEVDEVIAAADRSCSATKGRMTGAEAAEVSQKVRLGVMQQRSNARNTLRRP